MKALGRVYLGPEKLIVKAVAAYLAGGHILLEDVPGVGKTTFARALSQVTGSSISRVQCTPDLLPSDVVGFSIPHGVSGEFTFKKGPIFSNIVLVDEINRAAPRTQSAFLEAMEENQVTVEGDTRPLPIPFLVVATQNPVETAGTFPLPESQMDRFDLRLSLGYPPRDSEIALLTQSRRSVNRQPVDPVLSFEELKVLFKMVDEVTVAESLIDYVHRVGQKSRSHPSLALGISPRGGSRLHRPRRLPLHGPRCPCPQSRPKNRTPGTGGPKPLGDPGRNPGGGPAPPVAHSVFKPIVW